MSAERRQHSTTTTTEDGSQRTPTDERRARSAVAFAAKPKITMTADGVQLSVELVNRGPVSISGSVKVTFRGRQLHVADPDLSLEVGQGPVTLTYSLPSHTDLQASSRLEVSVVDGSGIELATSTTGWAVSLVPAGAAVAKVALVVVGLAVAYELVVNEPTPPPLPPPGVEEQGNDLLAQAVSFAREFTLEPARSTYPLGEPDAAVVELGPATTLEAVAADEYFGVPGGSVVRRSVHVRYGDQTVPLGDVTLPGTIPAGMSEQVGSDPLDAAEIAVDDMAFMTGAPLPAECAYVESGELIGGYRATGTGQLAAVFTVVRTPSDEIVGGARLTWNGGGEREYFPEVDVSAVEAAPQTCDRYLAVAASWQ